MREVYIVAQRDQSGTRARIITVEATRQAANAAARECRGLVIEAVSFEDEAERENEKE